MVADQSLLKAALAGYRRQRDQIDARIAEIRRQLATVHSVPARLGTTPKRTMSAATRKLIAAGQKRRWAAFHAQAGTGGAGAPKKKRQLSATAIKRISDATKKRWADYRAQKAIEI